MHGGNHKRAYLRILKHYAKRYIKGGNFKNRELYCYGIWLLTAPNNIATLRYAGLLNKNGYLNSFMHSNRQTPVTAATLVAIVGILARGDCVGSAMS